MLRVSACWTDAISTLGDVVKPAEGFLSGECGRSNLLKAPKSTDKWLSQCQLSTIPTASAKVEGGATPHNLHFGTHLISKIDAKCRFYTGSTFQCA